MNKIITIGREFGSGGRELGRRLSEELGIAYFDQEIFQNSMYRLFQKNVPHSLILSIFSIAFILV